MSSAAAIISDELVKPYEKRIERFIEKERPQFEINQPCTVTVKRRDGSFRKWPAIGGERFEMTATYLGKTGRVIFVFRPLTPQEFSFMELRLSEAKEWIDGFTTFLESAMNISIEEVEAQAERAVFEKKRAVYADDPNMKSIYGSW